MRKDFITLSSELQTRPISAQDIAVLRANAAAVRGAVPLLQEVKEHGRAMIAATTQELFQRHPDYLTRYKLCVEKATRDMYLVLGYAVYSAILNDPDYQKDRMLIWFRTIIKAFDFGDAFITFAYRLLQKNATARLSPESARILNLHIEEAISIFTSPNPNQVAVGA